jgi:hypothetical protein
VPTSIYFDFLDLDSSYSKMDVIPNETWLSYFLEIDNNTLRIDGRYDPFGILSYFSILNLTDVSGHLLGPFEGERLFSMVNIVEGAVPNYVGIAENEIYEYGVYSTEEAIDLGITDALNGVKGRKLSIEYVDGEYTDLNRTCVLTDNFIMDSQDNWVEEEESFNLIPLGLHYILRNMSKNPYGFGASLSYFVAKDTNWYDYINEIQQLLEESGSHYNLSAFHNGYSISILFYDGIMNQSFRYTPNGVLNVSIVTYNGTEVYSQRLNDFDYLIEPDVDIPIVVINTPIVGNTFGESPPNISITITEDHLDSVWYNLKSSQSETLNMTFTGTVDQNIWDGFQNGNITITVYANDTSGNLGLAQVQIVKYIPEDSGPSGIPGPELWVILLMIIIGIISTLRIQRKR